MGVLGLWEILSEVGHPLKVDALEGKKLGVDANIWLYKFIRGFRDKDNAANIDGHKLGLFARVSKLLFYKIKPVFVFDGPAPILKRRTLERRQDTRNKQLIKQHETAVKIFKDQLKEQYPNVDLDKMEIKLPELTSNYLAAAEKMTDEDRNLYYIPPLSEEEKLKLKAEDEQEEEDDDDQEESFHGYRMGTSSTDVDIDSKDFAKLPAEVRYELLKDIKESRRRIKRMGNLPEDANSFSNLQLERLRARRLVQEKIEQCERDICMMYTGEMDSKSIQYYRVQSDSNSSMIYVKNNQDATATPTKDEANFKPILEEDEDTTIEGKPKQSDTKVKISPPVFDIGSDDDDECFQVQVGIMDDISSSDSNTVESNAEDRSTAEHQEPSKSPMIDTITKTNRSQIRRSPVIAIPPFNSSSRHGPMLETKSPELSEHESDDDDETEVESIISDKHSDKNDRTINISDHQTTIDISSDSEAEVNTHEKSSEKIPAIREASASPTQKSPIVYHIDSDDNLPPEDVLKEANRREEDNELIEEQKKPEEEDLPEDWPEDSFNISRSQPLAGTSNAEPDEEQPHVSHSQPLTTKEQQRQPPTRPIQPTLPASANRIELTNENREKITGDRAKAERQTTRVTAKIIDEAKELLTLFGVPYIDAAGEAEAQCASLEDLKLTEGTITDDSDIWLFGAQNVYRHFFSEDKWLMHYKMKDIEHHIRMNRENLICFAMLVGSDYTDGIMNVGPVTAIEVLSEFPGESIEPLVKFKLWKEKYDKTRGERVPGSRTREKLLKYRLPADFPSRIVYDGYIQPIADRSSEKFQWGMPDLDGLREYSRRNFGWDEKKINDKLLPIMKKLNERQTQTTIDNFFFKTPANENPDLFRSKRVNEALRKIADKRAAVTATKTNPAAEGAAGAAAASSVNEVNLTDSDTDEADQDSGYQDGNKKKKALAAKGGRRGANKEQPPAKRPKGKLTQGRRAKKAK